MPNLQNIKRNTNDFSFTDTVASLVNNRDYKAGYVDLLNGKINDKTYFWTTLSAVGEEIGETIYENVLNYVNNVANINTCKLRPLTSIAKVLGVTEFAILKNLHTIPEDVLKLMDIFSINRSYLLNINNFNSDFVKDLLSSTLDEDDFIKAQEEFAEFASRGELTASFDELSSFSVFGAISNEKYEQFVEASFFKLLASKLFQTYGNVSTDFIYSNLSVEGNFSTTNELAYTRTANENSVWSQEAIYNQYTAFSPGEDNFKSAASDYPSLLYRYKKSHNVSPSFNESKIVDDIEAGLDFLDRYQGGELSVLQLEIAERAKTRFSKETGYAATRLDTRYSYYNEVEVKDYVKFIDDMYVLKQSEAAEGMSLEEISSAYLDWTPYRLTNKITPYFLNNNYSDITISSNTSLLSNIHNQYEIYCNEVNESADFADFIYDYYGNVFSEEVQEDEKKKILSKGNIVCIVARILKDICLAIVDIREKLKTQAQRNYMTGTKLLIEYILDEYLANVLINSYGTDPEKTKEFEKFGAQIVEYIDTTEYYNIGLLSDEAGYAKASVNLPYYSDLSNGGFTGSVTGIGLVANEIRDFYLSSLNIESKYISSDEDYYDFMSAVYEVGITKTFVGENGAIVLDKEFLDEKLSINLDIDKISAEHNLTDEDYDFLTKNWYKTSDEGYRTINFEVLSDYADSISSSIDAISVDLEKYNDALSTRLAQQTELVLKYHGTDIAYYPWYNYKNQDFPTFQAHPYLYNFVEHDENEYPIENAFYGNANEDLIYELQSQNISVYLGEYGNITRVWRNGNFDYSGYKSRYENSLHNYGSSNSNGLYSVTHYDGIFYPPAIELYKKYAYNQLKDEKLGLSGFDLLSVHMIECVNNGYYDGQYNLDIKDISSMWHYYSHLGLTTAERKHIVDQMMKLSADILEMSDAKYRKNSQFHEDDFLAAEPYDIYRYALDYNKNSLILLKRYDRPANDVSQTEKRNVPGQLWIKLNSHPIGFPAFLNGDLSSYAQVLLDTGKYSFNYNYIALNNVFKEAATSEYGSRQSINNIYDFDVNGNGQRLLYAVVNPSNNIEVPTFKNSVAITSKIVQRKTVNYSDPDAEIRIYALTKNGPDFIYPTNDALNANFNLRGLTSLSKSDYEFDGFFQSNNNVYLGYFKREIDSRNLIAVSINAAKYPSKEIASSNIESQSFAFSHTYRIKTLSTDFARTDKDAEIKLGYTSKNNVAGGCFTLVVANEILSGKELYIQDYIGNNIARLSGTEELSVGNGFTEYIEATRGNWEDEMVPIVGEENEDQDKPITASDNNYDSFDRFSDLFSIYDITETTIANQEANPPPMVYALNSDASYIPLYYGTDGQNLHYKLKDNVGDLISYNKEWHKQDNLSTDYVSRQSMELLGYSYQDFDSLIEDKENTIYKDDETGKWTSIDSANLLSNSLRIYEDYLSSNIVFEKYNDGQFVSIDNNEPIVMSFTIDLSSLTPETSSYFNVLMLNTSNGKDRNPIIAGPFSYDTVSSLYYDGEPTDEELYMISSGGFKPDNKVHIVGTPNPFNAKDTVFGLDYTNHIFNISAMSADLRYDEESEHFIIDLTMTKRVAIDFVIQSNIILLYVYKNTLDQFNKYHYMEPFSLFPYNAAISSWNMPWKDKSHADIFINGWYLSDGWQPIDENGSSLADWNNISAYHDKRETFFENDNGYKNELCAYGVQISSVVGHLPISAYHLSTNELSISPDDPRLTNLSLMENIELSSLSSFDDCYYLSTGQITWKISEEDKFNYLKSVYPPTLIDMLLYDKFYGINKKHVSYNIFELSNTYIFQLEDPLSMAIRIGTIAVPIGTAADEFIMAYEDYLSDQISVDIGGTNFTKYVEMLYDTSADTSISDAEEISIIDVDEEQAKEIAANDVTAINNSEITAKTNIEQVYEAASISGYCREESERNSRTGTIDYYLLSATPEEICDYLKIYVNWRRYDVPGHEDEIELFFNYPNLFMSPYSYKTKKGFFAVEYKKNTYMRLKSGEDGYLYIILQFKYYDNTGVLCGIRDLPILTYHIYNVSDDKPKFIVTKTFEIDNRDGRYTYPGDGDDNLVYIIIGNQYYGYNDLVETSDPSAPLKTVDSCIDYDFTLNCDLYLRTSVEVLSPIPLKYLNFEMLYERGRMHGTTSEDDPEFVFEPDFSKPGKYTTYKGTISANYDSNTYVSKLEFTMLQGASINEETLNRIFPIEIMTAEAEDVNGNHPQFVFINGSIEIDDNGPDIRTGAYLARELNYDDTPLDQDHLSVVIDNKKCNAGWILEERRRALIRMYSIGTNEKTKLLATIPEDDAIPLKTTGTRESRLDKVNNLFIFADNGSEN